MKKMTFAELESIVEAYESARNSGQAVEIAHFLPPPTHPRYGEIAVELLRVDLECTWNTEQPNRLTEYLANFPDVLQDTARLASVAFEEYRLRRLHGEDIAREVYQDQFGIDVRQWRELPLGSANIAPLDDGLDQDWLQQLSIHDPMSAGRLANAMHQLPNVGDAFLDYHLVGELGRGALGRVYLARQGDLADRFVALKVTPCVTDEPQRLAQLQHTNVVPIYSVHREGSLQAVCMPFLGANTLADIMRSFQNSKSLPTTGRELVSTMAANQASTILTPLTSPGREGEDAEFGLPPSCQPNNRSAVTPQTKEASEVGLGPAESGNQTGSDPSPQTSPASVPTASQLNRMSYQEAVVWILMRTTEGLQHAHEHGLVHSYLKPANILISDDGQPVILDFHLASQRNQSLPSATMIGGTLPYMAPEHIEVLLSGGHVNPQSDLFSLGVILFEMLTGHHPYPTYPIRHGSFDEVAKQMCHDHRQPPPPACRYNRAVSRGLDSVIAKCLAPELTDRYQSAGEFHEDLHRHLNHLPLQYARERSVTERVHKWTRRHPRIASATTVSIVATALLIALSSTLWIRHNRFARQEAVHAMRDFDVAASLGRATLNVPGIDVATLNAAVAALQETLRPYRLSDDGPWWKTAAYQRLSPSQQQRQRDNLAEICYLLAAGRAQIAMRVDGSERETQLRKALRFNTYGQHVFAATLLPRTFLFQRSRIVEATGKKDEAALLRGQANSRPTNGLRDQSRLAWQLTQQQKYQQATQLYRQLVAQTPHRADLWLNLGHCRLALGQWADANTCYTTALTLQGVSPLARFGRGVARLQQQNYSEAIEDFDSVLDSQHDWPAALVNRALARQGTRNLTAAVNDLDMALELGATQTRIYFLRARMKEQLDDQQGAEADRKQGLESRPTDEQSWIARGVYQLDRDPRAALADFQQALQINAQSRVALQNSAHALSERLGRPKDAIRMLDRLVAIAPDDPDALAGRGVLLARTGKRDQAIIDAQATIRHRRRPLHTYQAACIYALTSQDHKTDARRAVKLLASALKQSPSLVGLVSDDPDLKPLAGDIEFQRLTAVARQLNQFAPQP